ncbi:MAG TPA: type IV pilus assembly protein PilM [Candidatus Nanoarchaeia archaeon]|nr:type IV pilus assembly protein PilM [Candidatus Nanoarchaeia archaeon]
MRVPLIYREAPTFGFDIGSRTVKAIQIHSSGRHHRVGGYGYTEFPPDAIVEGIIADPELIAKSVQNLLHKPAAGHIASRRAIVALPTAKVFIRTLQLPQMTTGDLEQAIRFEAEQYVPVPISDLYIDYEIIGRTPGGKADDHGHTDLLMVAAPRAIVDSYIKLFDALNLELSAIETSLTSIARSFLTSTAAQQTVLMIDFGSRSADAAVLNKVIRLTGSIPVGGDDITRSLVKSLNIKFDQADEIKYKFGIGPSGLQPKIMESLDSTLKTMSAELKKLLKFYQERSENKDPVTQVSISGGTAGMPGLAEYIQKELGLPVTVTNPWAGLNMGHLPAISKVEAPMYATAIGLALRGDHD